MQVLGPIVQTCRFTWVCTLLKPVLSTCWLIRSTLSAFGKREIFVMLVFKFCFIKNHVNFVFSSHLIIHDLTSDVKKYLFEKTILK